MTPEQLRQRTQEFQRRVLVFVRGLAQCDEARDVAGQLRRAAMSVASNYRAAGRARSHREFTSKIGGVLEEADESLHWLELIRDCALPIPRRTPGVLNSWSADLSAGEFTAIFAASYRTAKANEQTKK